MSSMEGPQMRRRLNASAIETTAATSASGGSAEATRQEESHTQTPQPSAPSTRWSAMDIAALLVVSAAVLVIVIVAPQLASAYDSLTSEAAEHNMSVTFWTFLKEQYYLLPLPGRDYAAAEPERTLREKHISSIGREKRARVVRRGIDAEFERLAADPSLTRYGSTRIFFRPLPRKVYLEADDVAAVASMTLPPINEIERDAQGDAYVMTWGMADIDPLTNTLNPDLTGKLECGLDGRTRMKVMRTQRSMVTGVLLYSSYTTMKGEPVEDAVELIARGTCLGRVMELMCAGDMWEVFCPPEASASNTTEDACTHHIDVRSVVANEAPVARVEAELDYVVRQLPILERAPRDLEEASRQELEAELEAAPRMTRAALLQKVLDH